MSSIFPGGGEPTDVGRVRMRLYVAADAPNSTAALRNLRRYCDEHLDDRYELEVVDLIRDPGRVLTDGVFVTPMLVIETAEGQRRIAGSLREPDVVLSALGIET